MFSLIDSLIVVAVRNITLNNKTATEFRITQQVNSILKEMEIISEGSYKGHIRRLIVVFGLIEGRNVGQQTVYFVTDKGFEFITALEKVIK